MATIEPTTSNAGHYARLRAESVEQTVENRQLEQAALEARVREHKDKVQTFMEPETAKLFNLYAPTYIDLYA